MPSATVSASTKTITSRPSNMAPGELVLVILRGSSSGERFAVGASEGVVGRGAGVELRLDDPRVSRKHAWVSIARGGVRFRCFDGASPVVIGDTETRDGVADVGEQVIVGETVLAIEASGERTQSTDVKTLLSGVAVDVRGLSALVALTEALDGAAARTEVPAKLLEWGKRYIAATSVELVEQSAPRADVLARVSHGVASVTVPAPPDLRTSILFNLAGASPPVPAGTLRLLAVAGRVCGSTLARLDLLQKLDRERGALRSLAVGSARAFLGESEAACAVTKMVTRLAPSDVVVLIEGETGVGKTFVARLIHEAGDRARHPLIIVNCAAIPENLIETELFGHERGAFTGAASQHAGVFEAAGAGTVLLDEIGELPLASQSKLLHVLDQKSYVRVGSTRRIPVAARVLVATNRNLEQMVQEGTFRRDVFFRISSVALRIPPLRDRGDDLVLLARHLLADLSAQSPRRVEGFTKEAVAVIRGYAWPGNIRELRNVIEHAVVLGDGPQIDAVDFPSAVRASALAGRPAVTIHRNPDDVSLTRRVVELPASLAWLEKQAIEAALEATGGNRQQAAALLGINRVTLYKKLRAEAQPEGPRGRTSPP